MCTPLIGQEVRKRSVGPGRRTTVRTLRARTARADGADSTPAPGECQTMIVELLALSLTRGPKELLAGAVEGDAACVGGAAAVTRSAAFDGDDLSDFQCVARPSEPDKAG